MDVFVREAKATDANQRSFQNSDIGINLGSQKEGDIIGNRDILVFSFLSENRHFCFDIGSLDISNETPFKPGTKSLFKIWNIFWKFITGHDNLLRAS